jgi:D-sedoheptulose 7-phosphate isomerase
MSFTSDYRANLQNALAKVDLAKVDQAIEWLREVRDAGGQVFACGNGGSAATPSHFVCDMVKGASYQRAKRFKVIALTDNLATLTAYANDVSYADVFVEPLKNFLAPGDLLLGVSGSGNSENVLRAFAYANEHGARTIALTGRDGGKLGKLAQLQLNVPVQHMGLIEDVHMFLCHMIAYRFMDDPSY